MEMLEKNLNNRALVEIVSLEDLVPEDHLLRKIDAAVDFSKIYEFVEDLYCEDNGRPSIDPVILFKMVLIQHLYGITSLRRVAKEVSMNVAYRWFLGYSLHDETPHFSTLSYNFRKRFNRETVDKVFYWILDEIAEVGYFNTFIINKLTAMYDVNHSPIGTMDRMTPKRSYANEYIKEAYNLLIKGCKIDPNILDKRGNCQSGWRTGCKNGPKGYLKDYHPPIGWTGIGLKVASMYDNGNNVWLGNDNCNGEWYIGYHGVKSIEAIHGICIDGCPLRSKCQILKNIVTIVIIFFIISQPPGKGITCPFYLLLSLSFKIILCP